MQAKPRVTLALDGASGVHTLVLTSSIMDEALVDVCRRKIKSEIKKSEKSCSRRSNSKYYLFP